MIFDHINFTANTKTIEKIKNFYIDVFDLKLGERPTFDMLGYWLYSGNQAVLHLTIDDSVNERTSLGNLDHIAFKLDNFEAFEQHLSELNIPFRKKQITNSNCLQYFFKDPVGTGLEVNFDL